MYSNIKTLIQTVIFSLLIKSKAGVEIRVVFAGVQLNCLQTNEIECQLVFHKWCNSDRKKSHTYLVLVVGLAKEEIKPAENVNITKLTFLVFFLQETIFTLISEKIILYGYQK